MIVDRNFFDARWGKSGDRRDTFQLQKAEKDEIVVDQESALVWHRFGSQDIMDIKEAQIWLERLNTQGYAGLKNWRLPTTEEACSLLTRTRVGKKNLSAKFSLLVSSIWTCDPTEVNGFYWTVSFGFGGVFSESATASAGVCPVATPEK